MKIHPGTDNPVCVIHAHLKIPTNDGFSPVYLSNIEQLCAYFFSFLRKENLNYVHIGIIFLPHFINFIK